MINEEMIIEAMDIISAGCDKEFPVNATKSWLIALEDIQPDEFKLAFKEFVTKHMTGFLPVPADICRIVYKAREGKRLQHLPELSDVVSEIRGNLNSYSGPPKYSHPIVDEIVWRLGYQRLCESTSADNQRNITFAAKEALENYRDSDREDYTEEAERRFLERQAKEAKRLGNGGGNKQIGAG